MLHQTDMSERSLNIPFLQALLIFEDKMPQVRREKDKSDLQQLEYFPLSLSQVHPFVLLYTFRNAQYNSYLNYFLHYNKKQSFKKGKHRKNMSKLDTGESKKTQFVYK